MNIFYSIGMYAEFSNEKWHRFSQNDQKINFIFNLNSALIQHEFRR